MVFIEENFETFLQKHYPEKKDIENIEDQLIEMHTDCFGKSKWTPYTNFGIVIDIDEKSLQVKGFLNFFEKDENTSIIYNVCVNKKYRRRGILGHLLRALPNKYYYLEVLFTNRDAYNAYLNYFFCDFVGIGALNKYDTEASFILGGRPDTKCEDEYKNKWKKELDSISSQIEKINEKFTFDEFYKDFKKYTATYQYIHDNIDTILDLYYHDKSQLADEIKETLEFPETSSEINPLFEHGNKNILDLMLNYYNEELKNRGKLEVGEDEEEELEDGEDEEEELEEEDEEEDEEENELEVGEEEDEDELEVGEEEDDEEDEGDELEEDEEDEEDEEEDEEDELDEDEEYEKNMVKNLNKIMKK